MSKRYQEQIEVQLGEPLPGLVAGSAQHPPLVPTAFIWRGRLHVVRAVLGHWTQRLPWWRSAWGEQLSAGEPTELEQEVWRVEASPGRSLGSGVYELTSDECWRLVRVAD